MKLKKCLLPAGKGHHLASARIRSAAPAQLHVQRLTAAHRWNPHDVAFQSCELVRVLMSAHTVIELSSRSDSGWRCETKRRVRAFVWFIKIFLPDNDWQFPQGVLEVTVTADKKKTKKQPAFQTEHVLFTYFLMTTHCLRNAPLWERKVAR